jgi:hypothetical protein
MMASGDVLAANDHLHLPLAALIREVQRSGQVARATSTERGGRPRSSYS